jgi:hypothetical protein
MAEGSNGEGNRREIPPVPATRKTTENDDEKDSQMTLNRNRRGQDQRGINVVAAKSTLASLPASSPICEIRAICGSKVLLHPVISRNFPSFTISIPSWRALSSLLPASSPASR